MHDVVVLGLGQEGIGVIGNHGLQEETGRKGKDTV